MTRDDAACFGCHDRLPTDAMKRVGDAVFCRSCLERMLRRPAASPRCADGSGAVGKPVAAAADAPCFMCGEPLDRRTAIDLRGFAICAACARALAAEPVVEAVPEVIEEAIGEPGELSLPVTPGSGTEWCAACGRAMPGPGSYQLVEGRPHCAACVAATRAHTGPVHAATAVCDACDRSVIAGRIDEVAGFQLCAACRHSDPDLAVALARARHQRRLARAGRQLLDDGDD